MIRSNAGKPKGLLRSLKGNKYFLLSRHLPSADLRFFVEHFWSVQWNVPEPQTQENLPHPSVHLVVEKGNSRILGIVTGKFIRVLKGKGWVFGIKFRPGAFYPFAKFPLSSITNKLLMLEEVFGSGGTAYEEELLSLKEETEKIRCAEQFIRERLPEKDGNIETINRIVECVINDRTIVKVEKIGALFNINTRTLQRLFNQYVGVSPKWIIQRYRLLEAVEQMNEGKVVDWAKLALDLGYFDQAHFIKDFQTMVGKSPEEYMRSAGKKIK